MSTKTARSQHVENCRREVRNVLDNHRHVLKYIRNDNYVPVGVVIAYKNDEGNIFVGWSKCNMDKDHWNRFIGVHLALKRLQKLEDLDIDNIEARSARETVRFVVERAKKVLA